jgi:pimeloyl-ACP methyl ester carboxylesterase
MLVVAIAIVGGCSNEPLKPTDASVLEDMAMQRVSVLTTAEFTSYAGTIGGANHYEIIVPVDWNGELALYAHGFVDAEEPLQIPYKDNVDQIRDELVTRGFAFACCSFRENGFAVKDGTWSTRVVGEIFRSKVKQEPQYTWLLGHSLGALVAVNLAETYPEDYDGVLSIAGMIGGSRAEIDYMGDVRVLFDFFYGVDVLPGSVCELASLTDPNSEVLLPIVGAVTGNPDGLGAIAALTPLPGTTSDEFVESLITAVIFNYRGQPDLFQRLGGECPYANDDRTYEPRFPIPPGVAEWVNATVARHARANRVTNYFRHYYEPSGRLQADMLAIHLLHDPIVPVFHEQLYASKVAQAGRSHLLEQRLIDGYGHTLEIPVTDIVQGFVDLRSKVAPALPDFAQSE